METATCVTSLPSQFHYRGEPNEWVRMTRPGQRLHSFLEGLAIAPDGTIFVVDVPYGRVFSISGISREWSEVLSYDGEPHGLVFTPVGEAFIADYKKGIVRVDLSTRSMTSVRGRYNDVPFKGLSDLTVDSDLNIWFTDPGR